MVEIKQLLFPVIFLYLYFLNGCSSVPPDTIEEIHIEGVIWDCNVSTSYANFGSSAESEDQPEVRITACTGDLLYMVSDDLEFYYRCNREDGQHLVVSFDTSGITSVYVNGGLSFVELSGNASGLELFTELSEINIKQLSTLLIREELSDEHLAALQEHESSLHGIGLILEHEVKAGQLIKLLSLCRPRWMAINGKSDLPDPEEGKFLSGLELLWIDGEISAASKILDCCSNLESLIISDWEPGEGELLPLAGLNKLHSLTFAGCSLRDLSGIEFPPYLNRMHFVLCDTLSDISKLSSVPNLKSLILSGCDAVNNPGVIAEIESLKWLSFPPGISQSDFNGIMERQPSLEAIEILGCSLINDLSALEDHSELKFLTLDMEKEHMKGLGKLTQLKLIVLNSEIFEKHPETVEKLRAALPETNIVPGSGICLGSGWILLLLPAILVSFILFRKKQNSHISEN